MNQRAVIMAWGSLKACMGRCRGAGPVASLSCVAVLVAAGCANGGVNVSSNNGGTLVAQLTTEPDQLDPGNTSSGDSFIVLDEIYDNLVKTDPNLKITPDLATSWTTSSDQLTWSFTLRKAKWSDGTDFTSADVVYTFQRIIEGKLAWASKLSAVSTVSANGPNIVVLQLKQPEADLLLNLGGFSDMGIEEKSNVDSGAIKNSPIGTGPFELKAWQHGSGITLVPNPNYWGTKPKLGSIKFVFVSDPTVALQDLQGGEVQWIENLPKQQVASLQQSSGGNFVVRSIPGTEYDYMTLNETRAPYNDARVRQAIASAIDRDAIVKAAQFGNGAVNETAIPKSSPWYYGYSPYALDVAKAKSLLADAGVHNLTMDMIVTTGWAPSVPEAQVVASELSAIGITVKIRTLDFATWLSEEGAGHYDAYALAWIFGVSPEDFYYAQHHCKAAFNFQHYCSPSVDQLLDQAKSTPDVAQRKGLYDQAVKQIVDDASYIYLYNANVVEGWSTKLHGYTERGDGFVRFYDASVS